MKTKSMITYRAGYSNGSTPSSSESYFNEHHAFHMLDDYKCTLGLMPGESVLVCSVNNGEYWTVELYKDGELTKFL